MEDISDEAEVLNTVAASGILLTEEAIAAIVEKETPERNNPLISPNTETLMESMMVDCFTMALRLALDPMVAFMLSSMERILAGKNSETFTMALVAEVKEVIDVAVDK